MGRPATPDLRDVGPCGPETAERAADADLLEPDGGFWVFGYGSLIWRPGFAFQARRPAELDGFARRFCLWSTHYRGTPAAPGLVLGLAAEAGATTHGVAYRIAPEQAAATRAYLAERELISAAYREVAVDLRLSDGGAAGPAGRVRAVTYVIDAAHRQCALGLDLEAQAAVIEAGVGEMGRNCEYLFNTVAHLRAVGLGERELGDLAALERMVRARRADRMLSADCARGPT